MSYADFDIDSFQDYLEQKCVLNRLIAHNKVTDNCPAGQRTFSRFESEEHILQIQNNAGENILVVADVYGQRAGAPDDKRIRYTVQLRFAVKKKSGSGDNQDAINEAVKKAEKIMFQFVNMFEKEAEEGCNELEGYEPMETRWDKIEEQPWLDDYYGWDLNISFLSYLSAYDEADWEAGGDADLPLLVYRFKVGEAGAPMADGDEMLINNAFAGRELIIMIDGTGIPIDDFSGAIDWSGSIQRHAEKAKASNTINFVGAVKTDEIVEIYTLS